MLYSTLDARSRSVHHASAGPYVRWRSGRQTSSPGGDISVYTTGDTDLIIDVNGYFAVPGNGGFSLYPLTPCRVLDTRFLAGAQPFSNTRAVNAATPGCNVPTGAQALVMNATVVPPGALTYLSLWPLGQTQPVVSTLNAFDGAVTSNMAITPAAAGAINAYASNPTHLILDIAGYFAP